MLPSLALTAGANYVECTSAPLLTCRRYFFTNAGLINLSAGPFKAMNDASFITLHVHITYVNDSTGCVELSCRTAAKRLQSIALGSSAYGRAEYHCNALSSI